MKKTENTLEIKLADERHSVFQAHFPSNPILPGFVHLEIIEEFFELQLEGIKKAKFSAMVHPSQTLHYIKNGNKIVVTCRDKEVASFNIV